LLEDVFFAPILQALQTPGITRSCAAVDDVSFVLLASLRVLENSKTGRDFIQTHGIPNAPGLTRSNYFDGHHIAHATHDPRNEKGVYNSVSAIYKFDLRSGWMRFMDLARPTARGIEHEITTLKRQDKEDLRCGAAKGRSTLLVYDAAIIDFQYAYNLKQSKSIYILTAWKDNFAPMTAIPREIDRTNPANALIISDETIYFNNTPGAQTVTKFISLSLTK
jgi:hypothetical protein